MSLQQTKGVQIKAGDESIFATITTDGAINRLDVSAKIVGTLIQDAYDYIALTYVAAGDGAGEIETATYKTGGAAGTVVGTITLTYNTANEIASVART